MTFSTFSRLLADHPAHGIALKLPDGTTVPAHFHITEVGAISKAFLDCGGKSHTEQTCVLQVWVVDDYDHRIQAGKFGGILGKAENLFDTTEIPVEFEHEAPVLTRMPIESHEVDEDTISFQLSYKKADCLAKDICLPKRDFSLPDIPSGGLPKSTVQVFSRKTLGSL
ncbi:MAG: hypothetical protein ACJAVK_000584 [Akkermansiaceae bacterium]|jgi:hypothetical protein